MRASVALLSALVVAALLQLLLIHVPTLYIYGGTVVELSVNALVQSFVYGLPLGVAAILATEFLRLRKLIAQIAIGIGVTFLAAHFATNSEPLTSHVFTGGALTFVGLMTSGIAASATYWAMAGQRAGWRGDAAESETERATQAFHKASERHAKIKHCRPCLTMWAGSSAVAFASFAWLMIDVFGLYGGILSSTERQGQSALTTSGHLWATFKISDSLGAVEGNAPDELEKRLASDIAREALNAVTGFPGVLSRIDDKAVAQAPMVDLNQKLADAKRREQQAAQAIEEARRAAEAARVAELDAMRRVEEQATTTITNQTQKTELEQSDNSPESAELNNQTPDTRAPDTSINDSEVRVPNTPQDDEAVVAVGAVAPSAEQVGAIAPDPSNTSDACTNQDVAMVESSQIKFDPQTFVIATTFQRDLDRIAASVRSCPKRAVLVNGHSDGNADTLFNPALALQRAEAVSNGLVARGVGADQISIKATPVDFLTNTDISTEGRENFRRADFRFVEGVELSRDATQQPDERASNCETDLAEIMSQSIILFPIASARVSEESLGLIAKLAEAIQKCGSVIVTIEGHTDKIGSPERNKQLSRARADAVREALVAIGADPTRLASLGFAASRPFAIEDTAQAYALNRRIEFRVSGKFTATNAVDP